MKDTFRTGFRSCLKSFSKQYGPQIFQHIQKLRLEIYEQNRMRISLTHENESRPALVWSFTFDGIPKDRAARKCVDILMGGWRSLGILQPKTFEDFEIVDSDDPQNSAALRKSALKNAVIYSSSSVRNQDHALVSGGSGITPAEIESLKRRGKYDAL